MAGRQAKKSSGRFSNRPKGRSEVENRIKEGKNTLRWDKTRCRRFEANQAGMRMGVLAYLARRWYLHVASAFPLAHHYRAVLAWSP